MMQVKQGGQIEVATEKTIDRMTVKELRAYAIKRGLGITYLSERTKADLLQIIKDLTTPSKRGA